MGRGALYRPGVQEEPVLSVSFTDNGGSLRGDVFDFLGSRYAGIIKFAMVMVEVFV